jgi:hypothetical protein
MSSKYIPPSLRNKETTSEMPPMQRPTAFSKPARRPNNSSYWESRRRDEENEKKREAENAEKKATEELQYTETNFPSIIRGAPKTVTWSGRKFNDVIGDPPEDNAREIKNDDPPPFELPQFPNLRRRPTAVSRHEEQEYEDHSGEYFEHHTDNNDLGRAEPKDELNEGDGWTTVERKLKITKEKTLEEKFPEPPDSVWGEEEEDASCWDDRGRKSRH